MPTAAFRPCAGNCGARVSSGRCPQCARQQEQRRGSAASRGYGPAWRAFRRQFVSLLVDAGIPVICGATLPNGPRTQDSQCHQQSFHTYDSGDTDLHFDHEPPLQEHERRDLSKVCDPLRIQLLCGDRCHAAKSRRQQLIGRYR